MVQSCFLNDDTGEYQAKCIVNMEGRQYTVPVKGTEETMQISGKIFAESLANTSKAEHKSSVNMLQGK